MTVESRHILHMIMFAFVIIYSFSYNLQLIEMFMFLRVLLIKTVFLNAICKR